MRLDGQATALVFPGQGSQAVGMGRELAERYPTARQVFEQADAALGLGLARIMWDGPDVVLNDTVNTQPALFVHSLAAFRVLVEFAPEFKPAALAGHSLGELSALVAGGALSIEAGLLLVRKRGELMKRAGAANPGSMAAILNLDIPTLETVCASAARDQEPVQVANDNCPGQVVISGAKPAVERAMEAARVAGARRAIPLAVSIAAHSVLMASIQDEWNEAVAAAGIHDAETPIFGNVSAQQMRAGEDLRKDIQMQMQSRVRWTETIQGLAKRGFDAYVEVGTGIVWLGLIRRISPSAKGFPLGTPEDFTSLL